MKYAGFVKRSAAFVIDCLVIGICSFILYKITVLLFNPAAIKISTGILYPSRYLSYSSLIIISLVYYFICETLGQATLGKRLFSLKVIDNQGNQLTLINKLFRFLFVIVFVVSTQLPNILYFENEFPINENNKYWVPSCNYIFWSVGLFCIISYLCLALSSKNQTLYDKLTKSFVLEEKKKLDYLADKVALIGMAIIIFIFIMSLGKQLFI